MTRALPIAGPLAAAAALACAPNVSRKDSGVAVGNPGEMRARLAPAPGADLQDAWLALEVVALEDCAEGETVVAQDLILDLAGEPQLLLPPGDWCGLVLAGGELQLTAALAEGPTVEIEGEIDEILVLGVFTTDQRATLLQLGPAGWLDAEALGVDGGPGDTVFLEDEDEGFEIVAEALAEASSLVDDADRDGVADDGEAVLAAGEESDDFNEELFYDEDDEDDEDEGEVGASGCGGGQAAAPLALLLWPGLRRRRRRSDRSAVG